MSKSGLHDECKRRERELETLVEGQAAEINRLSEELDERDQFIARLFLNLRQKGVT